MYFAAHQSTTVLKVYSWKDSSNNPTIHNRAVTRWSKVPTPAPGPDGRDWTAFRWTNNCVLGGYARTGEVGFLWTSGAVTGRPRNFVRVARFRTSDLKLIQQRDIWNSSFAFHFPYAATNSRGHVGVTIAYGGGSRYPSAAAFIIDDYTSWTAMNTIYPMRTGRHGPASNRWGDYFHCGRNSNLPRTWVGMGFTKQTRSGAAEPRYVWFGRERDKPNWVNLSVQSAPSLAVSMTIDELDRFARGSGKTSLTRTYAPNQGYTITAPRTHIAGSSVYAFDRWRLRTSPAAGFSDRPVGLRTLQVSSIGTLADTAIAVYKRRRTLAVSSRHATSVPIAVDKHDLEAKKDGTTNFTRYYKNGTVVKLTAPIASGSRTFHRWRSNGIDQLAGKRDLSVAMTTTRTAEAIYGLFTLGSYTNFGTSCAGRNGTPILRGFGPPAIGKDVTFNLSFGPKNSIALFNIGLSRSSWGLLRLPFFLPGTRCAVLNDQIILLTPATDALGKASVKFGLPNDPKLVNQHFYTQALAVDLGVNRWNLTATNSVDTRIGGWQFR